MFNKVCLITQKFAETHYGGSELALGQTIKIMGVPFVIIGVFRESMETFGRSEIQDDTILIPYTVARRLAGTLSINQIYFTMYNSDSVPLGTQEILRVIKSRHRPESEYKVDNLTDVLQVAEKTANAFTLILLLFAVITLIVGGVGIMNIMLATVSARIREIGIRKAVGATRIEIELQFLTEAVLISLVGGIIGTAWAWPSRFRCVCSLISTCQSRFSSALIAIRFRARWESCSERFRPGSPPNWTRSKSLRHE